MFYPKRWTHVFPSIATTFWKVIRQGYSDGPKRKHTGQRFLKDTKLTTFEELRDECLKNGSLYVDPDFPANKSSLYFSGRMPIYWRSPITWSRPMDIGEKPVFIRKATYYDLNQGALGDCFFIAAVNSLMANDKKMLENVIPKDQNFDDKYAGIFRFNFWQYNEWIEIIINDRLPVKEGDLLYSRNVKEPDEFWICLLEKAYAKLYGSYANINGGFTEDALVDLTGGISEVIELKNKEYEADQLFKILQKMWKMDSLISMAIYQSRFGGREHKREKGLVEGHAYSVTGFAMVTFDNKTEKLIRLRNPWGKHEWNGAWSDKSMEWNSFSEEDRKKMKLTIEDEGEFWMQLEDAMTEFDAFNFCHKDESALAKIITDPDAQKAKWSSHVFENRWVKDVSSGGGDVDSDTYWRNPQYIIDLEHRTDSTWAVISLMEVMPLGREYQDISIGFDIYKMKPGVKNPPSYIFDNDSVKWRSFVMSTRRREKSRCIELPPGNIVIIVYNKEKVTCDFLLRIYCECNATVRKSNRQNVNIDAETTEREEKPLDDSYICLMAGRKVVESAAIRYGGRDGRLSLDDFIQCICRIFSISIYQRNH